MSNPPYIPEDEVLMPDVGNFEPRSALFSGEEGTDMLSALTDACKESEHCVGWVIECKSMQKSIVHP